VYRTGTGDKVYVCTNALFTSAREAFDSLVMTEPAKSLLLAGPCCVRYIRKRGIRREGKMQRDWADPDYVKPSSQQNNVCLDRNVYTQWPKQLHKFKSPH